MVTPHVPDELRHRVFRHDEAAALGVTKRMLNGHQWRRLHPRVWVHRDHLMTHLDWITAAALAMPDHAHLSHVSRLQALGLDVGEHSPIHFTVAGDLHLAVPGVFLHRTEVLPSLDAIGVTPAAAFIQYCATATVLEAVVAGDWLLANGHMTRGEVAELAAHHDWRPGAGQARAVLPLLSERSRSPKETQVRVLLEAAGLPVPECNAAVRHGDEVVAVVDLLLEAWRLALEYEGRQHAESVEQFQVDIVRYARLRAAGYDYVQITQRMLTQPRALVLHVHQALLRRGYVGPAPVFGARWASLTEPIVARPRLRTVG